MKHLLRLCALLVFSLLAASAVYAQWRCLYATYDDGTNGTGSNTPSVGVIRENMFIALVTNIDENCFMLPYVRADSAVGRKYDFGYSMSNVYQMWSGFGGFDQVQMLNAYHIKARPDSLIYVANNDLSEHNILVFKYENDTITTPEINGVFPRQITGTNGIFAVDVDNNGYVYVCNDTTAGQTQDVKVYPPVAQWNATHDNLPVTTIDLPDGVYKGIAASPNGTMLFVSDYGNRKILKFVGSPAAGYTQDNGFNFAFGVADSIPGGGGILPSLINLQYLSPNNILFAAADAFWTYTYSYGRIVLINPIVGGYVSPDTSISIIDQARWNLDHLGSYTARAGGTVPGNASGYTSSFDVKFDEKQYVYAQSNNGWAVEKWLYWGTLPVITGVEESDGGKVPEAYQLFQNYPNPFNPSTTIEFAVKQSGLVTVKVYNVLGQEVATLANEVRPAGTYRVAFDAKNLPSGTYFYTLRAGDFFDTKSMVLVK